MDATTTVGAEGAGRLGITSHAERGQRLADVILQRSRDAGLVPGGRLPTERQLSIDLGVTRSAVRHAMAILEAQGQISREVGRGTFLRDVPLATVPGAAAPGARPDGARSDGARLDGARLDGAR